MRGGGLEKTAGKGTEGWTNGASRGGRLEDGAAGWMEEAVVRTQDGEYRDGGDGSDRKEIMANFVTFTYITMDSRSFTKK